MDYLGNILSKTLTKIHQSPEIQEIDKFSHYLAGLYDAAKKNEELPMLKDVCQRHPIAEVFLEDPYVRRAFEKPRGYAGDAVMLDYIYRRPDRLDASPLGRAIHAATTELPNAKSILWRRDYFARQLRKVAEGGGKARILSVASGHMRELDGLNAHKMKNVEIWALDQDDLSIAECTRCYSDLNILPVAEPISYLFRSRRKSDLGGFDLIYSAGLSDYLSDKVLAALIIKLYHHLNRGASMVIGNFTPDSHGRGFMECFMDWTLIYRDEADLLGIAGRALPLAPCRTFRDYPGNVAYLEILKAA